MAGLNPRQLKFVERYLATGNATQSYIDAGYKCSRDSAEAAAARLLGDVRVQQLLAPHRERAEAERTETVARIEITRDRIREELARLSFASPKRLFRPDGTLKAVHEWDDDAAAAVASVEVEEERRPGEEAVVRTAKVKLWDKVRALKALGDTEPGVWVKGDGPGSTTNVNVAVLSDAELARRIDALEGRVEPASGPERLLAVAAAAPAAVQLGVAAPAGDPPPPPAGD